MSKLIASYEVHCTRCELPFLGIAYRRGQAITELRKYGWKQRFDGNWFCQKCVEASHDQR